MDLSKCLSKIITIKNTTTNKKDVELMTNLEKTLLENKTLPVGVCEMIETKYKNLKEAG